MCEEQEAASLSLRDTSAGMAVMCLRRALHFVPSDVLISPMARNK
jgi:hypothetical protein